MPKQVKKKLHVHGKGLLKHKAHKVFMHRGFIATSMLLVGFALPFAFPKPSQMSTSNGSNFFQQWQQNGAITGFPPPCQQNDQTTPCPSMAIHQGVPLNEGQGFDQEQVNPQQQNQDSQEPTNFQSTKDGFFQQEQENNSNSTLPPFPSVTQSVPIVTISVPLPNLPSFCHYEYTGTQPQVICSNPLPSNSLPINLSPQPSISVKLPPLPSNCQYLSDSSKITCQPRIPSIPPYPHTSITLPAFLNNENHLNTSQIPSQIPTVSPVPVLNNGNFFSALFHPFGSFFHSWFH